MVSARHALLDSWIWEKPVTARLMPALMAGCLAVGLVGGTLWDRRAFFALIPAVMTGVFLLTYLWVGRRVARLAGQTRAAGHEPVQCLIAHASTQSPGIAYVDGEALVLRMILGDETIRLDRTRTKIDRESRFCNGRFFLGKRTFVLDDGRKEKVAVAVPETAAPWLRESLQDESA